MELYRILKPILLMINIYADKANISSKSGLADPWEASKIVPDFLPKAPEKMLQLEFGSLKIVPGQDVTPSEVNMMPTKVNWENVDPSSYYTIIMADIDDDPEVNIKEWQHWVEANIRGTRLSTGDELTQFFPSKPPKDGGMHRYVFLVYKQPHYLMFHDVTRINKYDRSGRANFDTKEFAKKFDMKLVAGTFYLAQNEENMAVTAEPTTETMSTMSTMTTMSTISTMPTMTTISPISPKQISNDPSSQLAWMVSGIVPDVIPKAPESILRVYFGRNRVSMGQELTPTQVKNKPSVHWNAEPNVYYTLILSDPDDPSRSNPTAREWLHWMVGNIPGSDLSKGEDLAQYVSSAPSKGAGLQRYPILLFKQPGYLKFEDFPRLKSNSADGREKFRAAQFASKHGMSLVAGNLYLAQYDDYVREVYKSLGLADLL